MAEGIRLTMDIGNKMLRPLRQVQNRLQVDNLRCCAVDIFSSFKYFISSAGKLPLPLYITCTSILRFSVLLFEYNKKATIFLVLFLFFGLSLYRPCNGFRRRILRRRLCRYAVCHCLSV